jgi:DNA-binding MarR family transcriptional regulator
VLARELGLRLTTSLRPPLTPHRGGLPVHLVEPDDPYDALEALRPRSRRPLSPRIAALLRDGDTDARYCGPTEETDRSKMLAAIVTGCVNRGWSLKDAWQQLSKPSNRGGAKLHEIRRMRGEKAAQSYLRDLWRHQVALVRQHPPRSDVPNDVQERLDTILLTGVFALPPRIRGHSMWALLFALTHVAREAGSDRAFEASTRQLAERAGLSWQTTKLRLRDLVRDGWVSCRRRGIGSRGSVWSLALPTTSSLPSNPGRLAPPGGVLGILGSAVTPEHDAFRWRMRNHAGLGKGTHRLLFLLTMYPGQRGAELAAWLGMSVPSIRRLLKRLRGEGLIGADNVPCVPSERDRKIGAAARHRRTAGAGERQKRAHRRERDDYRDDYQSRLARHRLASTRPSDSPR